MQTVVAVDRKLVRQRWFHYSCAGLAEPVATKILLPQNPISFLKVRNDIFRIYLTAQNIVIAPSTVQKKFTASQFLFTAPVENHYVAYGSSDLWKCSVTSYVVLYFFFSLQCSANAPRL